MGNFQIGDRVKVALGNDNENYDSFRSEVLIITHADTDGPGYDMSVYPQLLMSFVTEDGEDVPFSLYEYEIEYV